MDRLETRNPNRIAAALIVGVAILGPAAARAQSTGDCLRVGVPSPIVLPDGSVHPAGTLVLCMSRAYSPVASLHRTYVDGRHMGLLLSRRGRSEGPAEKHPQVLFRRTHEGALELLGYAWPDGKNMNTYLMSQEPREGRSTLAAEAPSSPPPPEESRGPVIVLAARAE